MPRCRAVRSTNERATTSSESARCALELDAVLFFQQGEHFLARRVEQLGDFIDADRGPSVSFV
jgi:hypothetical protein